MASGSVTRREVFARDDEGRRVGAEVEEEISNDVKAKQRSLIQPLIAEPEDAEDDGKYSEAKNLK